MEQIETHNTGGDEEEEIVLIMNAKKRCSGIVIDIVNSLLSRHIIDNCESILRQINPFDIHLLCNSSVRSLLVESKCNPINVPLCVMRSSSR